MTSKILEKTGNGAHSHWTLCKEEQILHSPKRNKGDHRSAIGRHQNVWTVIFRKKTFIFFVKIFFNYFFISYISNHYYLFISCISNYYNTFFYKNF